MRWDPDALLFVNVRLRVNFIHEVIKSIFRLATVEDIVPFGEATVKQGKLCALLHLALQVKEFSILNLIRANSKVHVKFFSLSSGYCD